MDQVSVWSCKSLCVLEIFFMFRSDVAVSHLRKVMEGKVRSKRHSLFFNKKQRESCSANDTSLLHQLSNPSFLGGYGKKDSIVINELMEKVFNKYFDEVSGVVRITPSSYLLFILLG